MKHFKFSSCYFWPRFICGFNYCLPLAPQPSSCVNIHLTSSFLSVAQSVNSFQKPMKCKREFKFPLLIILWTGYASFNVTFTYIHIYVCVYIWEREWESVWMPPCFLCTVVGFYKKNGKMLRLIVRLRWPIDIADYNELDLRTQPEHNRRRW